MHPNQHNIFNTPLWGYMLSSEKYHSYDYLRLINTLNETETSQSKSNFGGWQSRDDLHKEGVFQEFNKVLLGIAQDILKEYTDKKPIIQSMWANINNKYNSNAHHTHEGWLSGVFYLKVPDNSGRLVFTNPAIRSEKHLINNNSYAINPEELACIIFPSWLEHYVEPNMNDESRISISFNIGE